MREYHPKTLLKTRSYPAYQLYASLKYSDESSERCMCYAILCIIEWLRDKIGDAEASRALEGPSPEDFEETDLSNFPSFHFSEGCSVDITSIPSRGIWALQIKEPEVDQENR